MAYAEVAVDAPVGVDRTFSYHVPPSLSLGPGHAVRVPFGPRTLPGLVFEITDAPQVAQTRDILGPLYHEPLLYPHQLALARWISRTYLCPLYEAVALMLPPGMLGHAVAVVTLGRRAGEANRQALPAAQRRVLGYLEGRRRARQDAVRRALGARAEAALGAMERQGLVVREWEWRSPPSSPRGRELLRLAPDADETAVAAVRTGRAPRQAALLEELRAGPVPAKEARGRFGAATVAALLRKKVASVETEPADDGEDEAGLPPVEQPPVLTTHQETAVAAVARAMDDPRSDPRRFLLFGVTGSGKTEVYLQALAHAVSRGRGGIVLVPEIALTPQTVARFTRRFPGRVAVLHGRLTERQRREVWWRVREGKADVVVGPRSALFAPLSNLGLIVLDEEHEWTYKQQETSPRYHARYVALELGRLSGAATVLGGATPDVETYHGTQQGRYGLLELPHRIVMGGKAGIAGPLARVRVVDMRAELRGGNRSIFSRPLQVAMEEALERDGQVMLFLNRRGTATHVQCRDCGQALRCRRCDTTLTYHGARGRLLCHLCGSSYSLPSTCPSCESSRIRYLGLGTQRVVQEVEALFPSTRVIRWDRDVATSEDAHRGLLERFLEGDAQVLVGTQMIAKGLHIPNVMVVGAVLADLGLHIPDFRAPERVFQVLCQVVGRAGRGAREGQAIIQTYQPHNYAIQAAAAQDFSVFYEEEMAFRRARGYPPFARLTHLVYSHTNAARCQQEAQRVARAVERYRRAVGDTQVAVVGPAPAMPSRLRGRYRWHLVLRAPDPGAVVRAVDLPGGWTVDVDPVSVT